MGPASEQLADSLAQALLEPLNYCTSKLSETPWSCRMPTRWRSCPLEIQWSWFEPERVKIWVVAEPCIAWRFAMVSMWGACTYGRRTASRYAAGLFQSNPSQRSHNIRNMLHACMLWRQPWYSSSVSVIQNLCFGPSWTTCQLSFFPRPSRLSWEFQKIHAQKMQSMCPSCSRPELDKLSSIVRYPDTILSCKVVLCHPVSDKASSLLCLLHLPFPKRSQVREGIVPALAKFEKHLTARRAFQAEWEIYADICMTSRPSCQAATTLTPLLARAATLATQCCALAIRGPK